MELFFHKLGSGPPGALYNRNSEVGNWVAQAKAPDLSWLNNHDPYCFSWFNLQYYLVWCSCPDSQCLRDCQKMNTELTKNYV